MFSGIEEFVLVATLGSFSEAARSLEVSPAHISRKIKALELRLGTRLLSRNTRSVALTEQGRQYFLKCKNIIDAMLEANDFATDQQTNMQGNISVAAGGDFSEIVIAPIISEFATLHPQIRIEIQFSNRNVNLLENNIDLAIRYGELKDSNDIARRLCSRSLAFAASKSYLQKHGIPKHPKELKSHRCITSGSRPWHYIEASEHAKNVKPKLKHKPIDIHSVWQSNSARTMVCHALNGNGIIYLPQDTISQFDTHNELVPIMEQYAIRNMPTYLVYPKRHYVPLRVRKLMDSILAYDFTV